MGDLSVPLFSHLPFGLKPGDAVEFQGDEGCAKSELLLNIAVNCVLPKSWNGVQLPEGRNVDVVYVSTDFKLDVLRLVDLLESRIGGALSKHGFQCDEELIHQCLSRVHVLYCKTSVEVVTALQSLKTYLHCNPNVCVLMLDNIATFYWIDKLQYASSNSMESRVAQGVEELMAEYHLVMFITKPQLFSSSAFGMSKVCASFNHSSTIVIICIALLSREYGSTLYVGMPRGKNGARIKRVH